MSNKTNIIFKIHFHNIKIKNTLILDVMEFKILILKTKKLNFQNAKI